ncbi:hypothetical protein F4678DRAFT_464179 [Xylaria arbuscula]|nr:hypothetical protein F4678DRAFT_464179 [Xylaria arbuscula]
MRFSSIFASLLSAMAVIAAPAPLPIPPDIPSQSQAQKTLNTLKISTNEYDGLYHRALFPTWSTIEGTCNTREYVLRRDGTDVQVGSNCYPISGTWKSPYDGAVWDDPADVDIDHLVPLKAAWVAGANHWTPQNRQAFANDITRPQLWAVTDRVNEAKGDQTPETWRPPLESFHCAYARAWIEVKAFWGLAVTAGEKEALGEMLGLC